MARILEPESNQGYLRLPIPCTRDQEIAELLTGLLREEDLRESNERHWPVLRVFAERMAALAVRRGDRECLESGLLALALAGLGRSADTLTLLSLFDDAALRLGLEPADLFQAMGERVGGVAREELVSFPRRSGEDRSLDAMGYREGRDADGFRYERTW